MKSITIHKLDDELYQRLKDEADKLGLSLNKMIKKILKSQLGLDKKNEKKRDISFLVGSLSKEGVEEFMENTADTRQIDETEW